MLSWAMKHVHHKHKDSDAEDGESDTKNEKDRETPSRKISRDEKSSKDEEKETKEKKIESEKSPSFSRKFATLRKMATLKKNSDKKDKSNKSPDKGMSLSSSPERKTSEDRSSPDKGIANIPIPHTEQTQQESPTNGTQETHEENGKEKQSGTHSKCLGPTLKLSTDNLEKLENKSETGIYDNITYQTKENDRRGEINERISVEMSTTTKSDEKTSLHKTNAYSKQTPGETSLKTTKTEINEIDHKKVDSSKSISILKYSGQSLERENQKMLSNKAIKDDNTRKEVINREIEDNDANGEAKEVESREEEPRKNGVTTVGAIEDTPGQNQRAGPIEAPSVHPTKSSPSALEVSPHLGEPLESVGTIVDHPLSEDSLKSEVVYENFRHGRPVLDVMQRPGIVEPDITRLTILQETPIGKDEVTAVPNANENGVRETEFDSTQNNGINKTKKPSQELIIVKPVMLSETNFLTEGKDTEGNKSIDHRLTPTEAKTELFETEYEKNCHEIKEINENEITSKSSQISKPTDKKEALSVTEVPKSIIPPTNNEPQKEASLTETSTEKLALVITDMPTNNLSLAKTVPQKEEKEETPIEKEALTITEAPQSKLSSTDKPQKESIFTENKTSTNLTLTNIKVQTGDLVEPPTEKNASTTAEIPQFSLLLANNESPKEEIPTEKNATISPDTAQHNISLVDSSELQVDRALKETPTEEQEESNLPSTQKPEHIATGFSDKPPLPAKSKTVQQIQQQSHLVTSVSNSDGEATLLSSSLQDMDTSGSVVDRTSNGGESCLPAIPKNEALKNTEDSTISEFGSPKSDLGTQNKGISSLQESITSNSTLQQTIQAQTRPQSPLTKEASALDTPLSASQAQTQLAKESSTSKTSLSQTVPTQIILHSSRAKESSTSNTSLPSTNQGSSVHGTIGGSLPASPSAPKRHKRAPPVPVARSLHSLTSSPQRKAASNTTLDTPRSQFVPIPKPRTTVSLNPFDSEDDEEEEGGKEKLGKKEEKQEDRERKEEEETKSASGSKPVDTKLAPVPTPRKTVSLNPFDSDDDEEEEDSHRNTQTIVPVNMEKPKPQIIGKNPFDEETEDVRMEFRPNRTSSPSRNISNQFLTSPRKLNESTGSTNSMRTLNETVSTNPFDEDDDYEDDSISEDFRRDTQGRQSYSVSAGAPTPLVRNGARASLPTPTRNRPGRRKRLAPQPPGQSPYDRSQYHSGSLSRGSSISSLTKGVSTSSLSPDALPTSPPRRPPPPRPPLPKTNK